MAPKIYPQDFITVEDFKRGYPDFEEHYFEDRKKPDGIPVQEIKVFLRVLYSKKAAALMVTEVGQVVVACVQPIEAMLLAPIIQIAGKINCGELIGRTVDDFKAREVFGVYDNHSTKEIRK